MLVAALCLPAVTEARRFTLNYDSSKVCSIMDAKLAITVTALDDSKELETVTVTSNHSETSVSGICGYNMVLRWPQGVFWTATEISPTVASPSDKPLIGFTVSFAPKDIFKIAPSYVDYVSSKGRKKAELPNEHSSFKCSLDFADYYINDVSGNITYKVLVSIHDIQIQLANVEDGAFSPPGPECHFRNTDKPVPTAPTPKHRESFWHKHWIAVIYCAVGLSALLVGIGVGDYIRRRQAREADETARLIN